MNCTAGLFNSGVYLTSSAKINSIIATDKIESIGMMKGLTLGTTVSASSFISIETIDENWKRRIADAGASIKTDPAITVVCMVTLNGTDGRINCQKVCTACGGIEIIHCPEKTLTIVAKNGFAENSDPDVKPRVSSDFRQPGHKAARPRDPVDSYRINDRGEICGPTAGDAARVNRHRYSASDCETIFVVFKHGATKMSAYTDAVDMLPQLCKLFANTNPQPFDFWESSNIQWTAGIAVELSTSNMLHNTATAKECLTSFRRASRGKIQDGRYFENRIKLGFTSTMSYNFMRLRGQSPDDARNTLSEIANFEVTFLDEIERTGEKEILTQLYKLGLPYPPDDPDRSVAACSKCSDEVGKRFDVAVGPADSTSRRTIKQLCIFCATKVPTSVIVVALPRPLKRRIKTPAKFNDDYMTVPKPQPISTLGGTIGSLARMNSVTQTLSRHDSGEPLNDEDTTNNISPTRKSSSGSRHNNCGEGAAAPHGQTDRPRKRTKPVASLTPTTHVQPQDRTPSPLLTDTDSEDND